MALLPFASAPGTGGIASYARTATLVVAASNAKDTTNADYVCDGTDDHVQIEAAIAALPSGGGRVILTEGLFTVGATVDIAKSGVTLEGQGASSIVKLANTKNVDVIKVGAGATAYNHIEVRNLKVDGNMANQTTAGHGINIEAGLTSAVVEGCWITNTLKSNVYDNGAPYTSIIDNYLETTKVGLNWGNIEGVGNYGMVKGNTCIAGDFAGISVYKGNQGTIVQGNVVLTPTGIGIEANSGCSLVSENFISNPGSYGILATWFNMNVIGNVIKITNNPTQACIHCETNDPKLVANNTITVLSGNTAAVTGITLEVNSVEVTANIIQFETTQAHKGIVASGTRQYIAISNNDLVDVNGTPGGFGMDLSASLTESTVTGNVVRGFNTGMDITGSTECTVSSNSILESVLGMTITNVENTTINGNVFFGVSATYAIKAVNTVVKKSVSIVGNTFEFYSGTAAISLQGVNGFVVSDNTFRECKPTDVILITSTGTAYSTYNTVTGNAIIPTGTGSATNGIKENSANDGPNIILGNIVKGPTNPIVTAHASTDVSHNLTS